MGLLTRGAREASWLLLAGAVLAGCTATQRPSPLRPAPVEFADTLPARQPAPRTPVQVTQLLKASVGGEIGMAFSLRNWTDTKHEAANVTLFDDVVSSAWFQHRNWRRRLTPDEIARGPTAGGPDPSGPLTVVGGKSQGISPGFTVRDAGGDIYRVKFDPKGNLHLASAAGVISNRLMHAVGYNVPEDYILVFDRERLVLDPEAEVEDELGFERSMTEDDVSRILALTDSLPDGRFLAIASKQLPGVDLGPFLFRGVRRDDPNDYYHHEYRRELRGLYVVSAWLNHVDMRYENTLDLFVPQPGYVRHYLIDFAATLGSGTIRSHSPREGLEYNFDFWPSMGRLLTLGFFTMGWEDRPFEVIHPSIGWMPVEEFDPPAWRPNWPNAAFNLMTLRDAYWGAKLVGSFDDEQLRAAVAVGRLPSAAAADTLVRILAIRRDRTVEYWYGRVTPVERVELDADGSDDTLAISFEDLGLATAWSAEETEYRFRLRHGPRAIDIRGVQAATDGSARQRLRFDLAGARDLTAAGLSEDRRVATLEIAAWRPRADGRTVHIYLRWEDPETGYRLIGLDH